MPFVIVVVAAGLIALLDVRLKSAGGTSELPGKVTALVSPKCVYVVVVAVALLHVRLKRRQSQSVMSRPRYLQNLVHVVCLAAVVAALVFVVVACLGRVATCRSGRQRFGLCMDL